MPWTKFMDMHSGGGSKEPWEYIYIEAPEDTAKVVFYNRFGHNPERVSCTCCGEDYSITESQSLAEATAFERGCKYEGDTYIEEWSGEDYRPYTPLNDYLAHGKGITGGGVLAIYSQDIKPDERVGDVPEEGYVWKD